MTKLIGINKQIKESESWLKSWKRQRKKGLILYGHVGTGKTTLSYQIAEKFGYEVVEFNASDSRNMEFMEKLSRISKQVSFSPTLILLDECDVLETRASDLKEIIEKTQKPIIITTNYYTKLSAIKKVCKSIQFYKPKLSDLAYLDGSDVSKLSGCKVTDFRQAFAVSGGSQGYTATTIWKKDKLIQMIRNGRYESLDYTDLVYLLDSSIDMYGFELYEWIKALACYDRIKRDGVLNGMKPSIKDVSEFYFSKKRLIK